MLSTSFLQDGSRSVSVSFYHFHSNSQKFDFFILLGQHEATREILMRADGRTSLRPDHSSLRFPGQTGTGVNE